MNRDIKKYYRTNEVAEFIGLTSTTVKKYFDNGQLSGYRLQDSGDRMISRRSLLRYAMVNRMHIPKIGMHPYTIVSLGVSPLVAAGIQRAAEKWDAAVMVTESEAEFGLLIADGEKCCAIVDTSIGQSRAIQIGQMIRSHLSTKDMLLIAIAGEDSIPDRIAHAGYDNVYPMPFNISRLVTRIGVGAKEFRKREKVFANDNT